MAAENLKRKDERRIKVKMPAVHEVFQPPTLETLAIQKIGSWISTLAENLLSPILVEPRKAEDLISRQIKNAQKYLEYVPKRILNIIAERALVQIKDAWMRNQARYPDTFAMMMILQPRDPNNPFERMIEVFCTKNLTSLSILRASNNKDCRRSFFISPLRSKAHMLSNLKHLNLCVVFEEFDIIKILPKLRSLESLHLYKCTNQIISCISKKCRLIEELESRDDIDLSETSMKRLTKMPNLKRVSLIRSSITPQGMEILLQATNIDVQITPAYRTEKQFVFEKSVSKKKYVGRQLGVKYYETSVKDLESLQLVIKTCPLIESVSIYKRGPMPYISPVSDLKTLSELRLFKFKFYEDRIDDILETIGHRLTDLSLDTVDDLDLDALKWISQNCSLQTLFLGYCSFNTEIARNLFDRNYRPIFENLRNLSVGTRNGPWEEQMFYLLSSCPNIEFIEIHTTSFLINDKFMLDVLDNNPIKYLKEMVISSPMQIVPEGTPRPFFIDRILQNCVNKPKIQLINSNQTHVI